MAHLLERQSTPLMFNKKQASYDYSLMAPPKDSPFIRTRISSSSKRNNQPIIVNRTSNSKSKSRSSMRTSSQSDSTENTVSFFATQAYTGINIRLSLLSAKKC